MFTADQYELLDFGRERKLERFGPFVVERPSPPAGRDSPVSAKWRCDAKFDDRGEGSWTSPSRTDDWTVRHGDMVLGLRTTPAGQVGVFPEQAANWDWIGKRVRAAQRPLKVLNLFAYTGGSTLAAAAAGAEVVHVDAARNVVQWARDNADLSGLSEAPIRWIDEDAGKFVRRELRRGNRYDAVILDPPSYGHGPKGEPWKIVQHLPGLLADCADVTKGQLAFVVLSCHSPGFGPAELEALVHDAFFGACQQGAVGRDMWLRSTDGRGLTAGSVARWPEMNPIDRND